MSGDEDIHLDAETHLSGVPSSWATEAKTSRFTKLRSDFDSFRSSIYTAKKDAPNEPLPEMAYEALAKLSDAIRGVFEDPLSVAKVKAEPNEEYGERERAVNSYRNGFLINLTEVMELLNITPEDLQDTIDTNAKIGDGFGPPNKE